MKKLVCSLLLYSSCYSAEHNASDSYLNSSNSTISATSYIKAITRLTSNCQEALKARTIIQQKEKKLAQEAARAGISFTPFSDSELPEKQLVTETLNILDSISEADRIKFFNVEDQIKIKDEIAKNKSIILSLITK